MRILTRTSGSLVIMDEVNFKRHTQIYGQQPRQPYVMRSVSYPSSTHGRQRKQHPKSNRFKLLVMAVFAVAVVAAVAVFWPSHNAREAQGQVAGPQPEPVKHLDFQAMSTTIEQAIQANPGMDVGVAVVDIKTGDTLTYGVQEPFVAASTAKLLTAIAYLHDVEKGRLTLDQPVGTRTARDALDALIVDSDNQAWNDLNNVVMSHAELAEYANQIGFANYDPDNNTVVPGSLATLLSNLYQKRLLNESHTTLLLSFMQRAKEVDYITSIVPSGVSVYHKPGYLSDRVHDALIIDNNERPYSLVILSKSRTATYDTTRGQEMFSSIGKATFQTFLQ